MYLFALVAASEISLGVFSTFLLSVMWRMGACLLSMCKMVLLICSANLFAERLSEINNVELARSVLKEDQSIKRRLRKLDDMEMGRGFEMETRAVTR